MSINNQQIQWSIQVACCPQKGLGWPSKGQPGYSGPKNPRIIEPTVNTN